MAALALAMAGGGAGACGDGSPSSQYPDRVGPGQGADASTPADAATTVGDGPIEPDDIPRLTILLREGRLPGWIHGAVHDRDLYVFTYRKPGDFFSFADFPVTASSPAVAAKLLAVKRHDAVMLRGSFVDNTAPIRHIRLDDLTVVTTWVSDEVASSPHAADTEIPADLAGLTEVIGKVHAVNDDGRVLVIEYGDAVIPVFVRVPALTAGLYRNDKIQLAFEVSIVPPRPTHLWLDTAHARPLQVLERLLDRHGQPFQAEGVLVRFPKSPQISTDVYALQSIDSDGVSREYTLLNESGPVFQAIQAKLSAAWRAQPQGVIDGRNKLINPSIRIRARGTFNLVAPNQANAQIFLDSAADVAVLPPP